MSVNKALGGFALIAGAIGAQWLLKGKKESLPERFHFDDSNAEPHPASIGAVVDPSRDVTFKYTASIHHPASIMDVREKFRENQHEVVDEYLIGDMLIREFEGIRKIKGAPLVEGFQADGNTAGLAASYLIETLDLPLIGDINCPSFPDVGVVSDYHASSACSIYGDERIVVVAAQIKVGDDEAHAAIATAVADALLGFCEKHSLSMLISVEGIPTEVNSPEDLYKAIAAGQDEEDEEDEKKAEEEDDDEYHKGDVIFVSNNTQVSMYVCSLGGKPMKDGVIQGVSGALLAQANTSRLPFVCLLSPSSLVPDGSALCPLIKVIDRLIGPEVEIDLSDLKPKLDKLAKDARKAIEQLIPASVRNQNKQFMMYT